MKTITTALTVLLACAVPLCAADFRMPSYYTYDDFLMAPPGAMGATGLNAFVNPALLSYVEKPDVIFSWSDQGTTNWDRANRWGVFFGLPHFSYGVISEKTALGRVNDNRVSLGLGGDKGFNLGIGYGWSEGDTELFDRTSFVTAGALFRPNRYLSFGLSDDFSTKNDETQLIADMGIRPFGSEKLTLFADYASQRAGDARAEHWSTGAVFEFQPGMRLTARYFDTDTVAAGLNISFGFAGAAVQGYYDKARAHKYNTYTVQAGYDRNVFTRADKHAELDLHERVGYQRYVLFDNTPTLFDTIAYLDSIRRNPTVAGVIIDASGRNSAGISGQTELLWEIREKLAELKAAGKEIIVYVDNPDFSRYYFASVASKVVLDPLGSVELRGVRFGTFYLKGTLGKLGIGFDEIRFLKYKSAVEAFSRTNMSDADREQLQRVADTYYATMRAGVCKARKITEKDFDVLVNEGLLFTADEALQKGLVDQLERWDSTGIVSGLTGKKVARVTAKYIEFSALPSDDRWGPEPTIAVIYAIGATAMDGGMNARRLSKDIETAAKNPRISAVVIRVDSPGGDGIAADLVAEAIRRCRAKKPVIVSQGFLAASGGYWVSMYGEPIVASPLTLTGSIGVISAWVYDSGLKSKLGVTTDYVKVGKYADLGVGMPVPLLGALPDRDLDPKERAIIEADMLSLYGKFVSKVASGRRKDRAYIETVAQGRIWTGEDAKQNGLVDAIGGLDIAIRAAKKKLGYPEDRPVYIVELPRQGLFNPSAFMPRFPGVAVVDNALVEQMKFRVKHNGTAMPLLPSGYVDPDDR